MRAVIQRVKKASVFSEGEEIGSIQEGLLVFLGIGKGDSEKDIAYLTEKIFHLRIFHDAYQKMNQSLLDKNGEILIVSQFTLYGDCRKGRRPSFDSSENPSLAHNLYEKFIISSTSYGLKVETGKFQANMQVSLINDGPVTFILDSTKQF